MDCILTVKDLAPGLNLMLRKHFTWRKIQLDKWVVQLISERNKLGAGFPLALPCKVFLRAVDGKRRQAASRQGAMFEVDCGRREEGHEKAPDRSGRGL